MTWTDVADVAAAACLLVGALLTLIAAIGILRFPTCSPGCIRPPSPRCSAC